MRYYLRTLLLIASLLAVLGCQRQPVLTPPTNAAKTPASYSYEIRTANGKQFGVSENIDARDDGVHLVIHEGRLTVNDRPYGQLKNNDSVLIDESGQVLVNGQPRQPE